MKVKTVQVDFSVCNNLKIPFIVICLESENPEIMGWLEPIWEIYRGKGNIKPHIIINPLNCQIIDTTHGSLAKILMGYLSNSFDQYNDGDTISFDTMVKDNPTVALTYFTEEMLTGRNPGLTSKFIKILKDYQ